MSTDSENLSDEALLSLLGSSPGTIIQAAQTDKLDSQLQIVAALLAALPELPAEPSLVRRVADGTAETVAIKDALAVGRASACRIVLRDDTRLSKKHFEVKSQGGGHFLSDCDSTNGTLVNDCRLANDESRRLLDGDVISAGNNLFVFLAGIN